MRPSAKTYLFTAAMALLWMAGVGWGGSVLLRYGNRAGATGVAGSEWPAESRIDRVPGLPTLVMLVHPQCPCTRASVGELAMLMAHFQGKVSANILFAKPAGAPDDWEKGGLWNAVSAIPGVHVQCDAAGLEAKRFGVETSGQVILFDREGRLLFRGGITSARGHAGANAGSEAIDAFLNGVQPAVAQTSVFGCSLF